MQLQHQEIAIMTAESMCISPVFACFGQPYINTIKWDNAMKTL